MVRFVILLAAGLDLFIPPSPHTLRAVVSENCQLPVSHSAVRNRQILMCSELLEFEQNPRSVSAGNSIWKLGT